MAGFTLPDETTLAGIRHLEELSLNALPALHTAFLDGWVLRASAGFTRRANAVHPLYPAAQATDADARARQVERFYGLFGLPATFKLTAAALPDDLDGRLERLGYQHEAGASVQTADLAGLETTPADDVRLLDHLDEDWLAAYFRLNQREARHLPVMRQMLLALARPARFAALTRDGAILSLGLAVVDGGYAGLFDIVTDPAERGRGLASRLILTLLAEARRLGAERAYLQVHPQNGPALRLYGRLGFREAYPYWYRVLAPTG